MALIVFALNLGEIVFISFFYVRDARYILQIIPSILIGFTFFLTFLWQLSLEIKKEWIFMIIIFFFSFLYLSTNIIKLKNQVVLNLKYAEVPWYYISVLKFNEYFSPDKNLLGKKPFVITATDPYYVDFYSNGNYNLLPLSDQQTFWKERGIVWGDYNYSDLLGLYKKLIKEGNPVYLADLNWSNVGYLSEAVGKIANYFKIVKVYEWCNQCGLYKLEIKK